MLAKRVARVNLQKMQKRRAISAQKVSTKMKRLHLTILAKGAEPASFRAKADRPLVSLGAHAQRAAQNLLAALPQMHPAQRAPMATTKGPIFLQAIPRQRVLLGNLATRGSPKLEEQR